MLQERYDKSRTYLQDQVKNGFVYVDGVVVKKPGTMVDVDAKIEMKSDQSDFVSRAGLKLEHALKEFNIDVTGLVALDAGMSTGGFTDCLLQRGASHVYGVDVGTNQLDPRLADHPQVTSLEQTDIRDCVGRFPLVDIVTVDLSFISVLKVIDVIKELIKPGGKLVVLIKPQFETHKKTLNKGKALKSAPMRDKIAEKVVEGIKDAKFYLQGFTESNTPGKDGSIEYLAYFTKGEMNEVDQGAAGM